MSLRGPRRRRSGRGRVVVLGVLAVLAVLAAGVWTAGAAQPRLSRGQEVVPAYEGWERNADGSFNLVFGTMNRNWEEELDIPIGPANHVEPGGPDRGQPTHFLPGATASCSASGRPRTSARARWCGR